VQTDGSLFDAMRAATWTMGGPDRLAPFIDRLSAKGAVVVEPEWEEALRTIDHTPLRDHLRNLCRTPYWTASHGSQISNEFACLAGQRRRPVAGWHFGHAQACIRDFPTSVRADNRQRTHLPRPAGWVIGGPTWGPESGTPA
jgi:hypothetical protein